MAALTIGEIAQSAIATFQIYCKALDSYSEGQFWYKQSPEIWSLEQMYEHICKSSSHFFLANTIRCLEERKGQLGGEMNENGHKIIGYNSFPPMKFGVPNGLDSDRSDPKGKEFYIKYLEQLISNTKETASKLAESPSNYRCHHPVFEWLNSNEWFQMLDIHIRHHLRQQKELEGYVKEIS